MKSLEAKGLLSLKFLLGMGTLAEKYLSPTVMGYLQVMIRCELSFRFHASLPVIPECKRDESPLEDL